MAAWSAMAAVSEPSVPATMEANTFSGPNRSGQLGDRDHDPRENEHDDRDLRPHPVTGHGLQSYRLPDRRLPPARCMSASSRSSSSPTARGSAPGSSRIAPPGQ